MCTAITYKTKDFYFGRTLDCEFSYGEEVIITPRNFAFHFRNAGCLNRHFAMIGTAIVADGYPLYYDAVNEKGLGMAGLNFVGNACYKEKVENCDNIAQFEVVPWILAQCSSVDAAIGLLKKINIDNTPFNSDFPPAQLHWILADHDKAVTVEAVKEGIMIYNNPVGVLTNNPPFNMQLFQLNNFMKLSSKPPKNGFSDKLSLNEYSRGMGAIGLPGDLSSQSRFVRASFVKMNSVSDDSEKGSVGQFFHILGSAEQQKGCCETEDGKYEITIYTSCCNADKGIYYYTKYENHQITAVNMHHEDLESRSLIHYPMISDGQINFLN